MDRNGAHSQPRAHEHHDRRFDGPGEFGEILGVSGMVEPGAIETVFVDWVGDDRRGAPAADIADGVLDGAEDGRRIAGVGPARLGANGHPDGHDRERLAKGGQRSIGSVDRANRYRPVEALSQRVQALRIVNDVKRWDIGAPLEPSPQRDLAAYPGRLAHCYSEWKRHRIRA